MIDICRWMTEFVLRSSVDDQLLKKVLANSPLREKDKKPVLLQAIKNEISEAVVSEKLLEIFEVIEELDKAEGVAIIESMKAAYCAVAVECTVKYMAVEGNDKQGKYFDAVTRIWRGRLTELERVGESALVSLELKAWKEEVEAALCDKNVWEKLVKINSRYEAFKRIGDYLGEAWAGLGPIELPSQMDLENLKHSFEDGNDAGAATRSCHGLNSTACEGKDSIDGVRRLHLPSPKRKVISPLKKYEETRIIRRRNMKRWSSLEAET